MSNVYATHAAEYISKGWKVIPVNQSEGGKSGVPGGCTGHNGTVTLDKMSDWLETPVHPDQNIAIRVEDMIGLDVDDYGMKHGAEQLRSLENAAGDALPDTFMITARGERDRARGSGTRLYRTKPDAQFRGQAGVDIEVIQKGHRYAVTAPSLHHTGGTYSFYNAQGEPVGIPSVADIPYLPEAFYPLLEKSFTTRSYSTGNVADVEVTELRDWGQNLSEGDPSEALLARLNIAATGWAEGRYEPIRDAIWFLVHESLYAPHTAGLDRLYKDILDARLTSRTASTPAETRQDEVINSTRSALAKQQAYLSENPLPSPELTDWAHQLTTRDPDSEYRSENSLLTEDQRKENKFKLDVGNETLKVLISKKAHLEAQLIIDSEGASMPEFFTLEDMESLGSTPLIADLLDPGTINFLLARSQTGKTFLMLDAVLCMAFGIPFLGHDTQETKTIYYVGEGAARFFQRVDAWLEEHSYTRADLDGRVKFARKGILTSESSLMKMREQAESFGPGLLVFDTWGVFSGTSDENDSAIQSRITENAKSISPSAAVMFLHHPRKGEQDTKSVVMRGSSALDAGADNVWVMYTDKDFVPKMGMPKTHTWIAFTTERDSGGKTKDSRPVTHRGLYLKPVGQSVVMAQEKTESISKSSEAVRDKLKTRMTVKDYTAAFNGSPDTNRRHLDKAVQQGVILAEAGNGGSIPTVYLPILGFTANITPEPKFVPNDRDTFVGTHS